MSFGSYEHMLSLPKIHILKCRKDPNKNVGYTSRHSMFARKVSCNHFIDNLSSLATASPPVRAAGRCRRSSLARTSPSSPPRPSSACVAGLVPGGAGGGGPLRFPTRRRPCAGRRGAERCVQATAVRSTAEVLLLLRVV